MAKEAAVNVVTAKAGWGEKRPKNNLEEHGRGEVLLVYLYDGSKTLGGKWLWTAGCFGTGRSN